MCPCFLTRVQWCQLPDTCRRASDNSANKAASLRSDPSLRHALTLLALYVLGIKHVASAFLSPVPTKPVVCASVLTEALSPMILPNTRYALHFRFLDTCIYKLPTACVFPLKYPCILYLIWAKPLLPWHTVRVLHCTSLVYFVLPLIRRGRLTSADDARLSLSLRTAVAVILGVALVQRCFWVALC